MTERRAFDVAVIGSGPGGYRAAVLAALRGLKVAIVEKSVWGGCCLNRGCVPKKAWYDAARAIASSERWAAMGVEAPATRGDLARAWAHQRRVVDGIRASYLDYLRRLGVVPYHGVASLAGRTAIALDGAIALEAGHIIIATGSAPFVPEGFVRTTGRILTTDDLFESPLPGGRRVGLVGSGVVACELAFILTMLGCEVTWVARSDPLAGRDFTVPARTALAAALRRHGIEPRLCPGGIEAAASASGAMLVLDRRERMPVDWVLLGTGRRPHTQDLALARSGIEVDAGGFIAVDEHGTTSAANVSAIGDVLKDRMTSNRALADAAVVVANILRPASRRRRVQWIPEVIYSAVELARIGCNEDQAEAQGHEVATGFVSYETEPAAIANADTDGFVRIVADAEAGALLGAEIAGTDAGTLIQLIEQAAHAPDALAHLARGAYNHPGRAEAVLNAVETLAARWGLAGAVFGPAR